MEFEQIKASGMTLDYISLNTLIVGSGAAGFNAADSLHQMGQTDIAIITEGIKMGTSRNTGSDKQTYYKLSLEGGNDSIREMAQTLFSGGGMDGSTALVEAALSAKSFYKLVDLGVPFPHNRFGEYVGYKTDHDPSKRATSAGPLTSKYMTECLERQVVQKGIMIFDGFRVIALVTDEAEAKKVVGLVAINESKASDDNMGITVFGCTNIIYAVGGPAGMYLTSVYPSSQTGASGLAFEAGADGCNLTESQYGIASTKFRWNLSGTYQQVIPRYISTNEDGSDEKEFLEDYFEHKASLLDCIFLKGYQWPFDPRKISDNGSSIIDLLVYNETQLKGRRVFIDFMNNPLSAVKDDQFDFDMLGEEAYDYLDKSDALFGKPIDRLEHMNQPAIQLYKDNGIDLYKEYLEIDVCAQHNNGGLDVNIWWESNIKHFFPVGEVAGTLGVYRPGGSALNSTQVGSFRAAQYICGNYKEPGPDAAFFAEGYVDQLQDILSKVRSVASNRNDTFDVLDQRSKIQENMTKNGAHIRSKCHCDDGLAFCENEMQRFWRVAALNRPKDLKEIFINWDILVSQYVYLYGIKAYIENGGGSRGSYIICNPTGIKPGNGLPDTFRFKQFEEDKANTRCITSMDKNFKVNSKWEESAPIPDSQDWFEKIWAQYRTGDVIK